LGAKSKTSVISSGSYARSYELFIPKCYDGNKEFPVVFVLHGGGGKGKGMEKYTGQRFNQLAERDSFILVYPNGYKKGWNDGARDTIAMARRMNIDDVGFFNDMIQDLALQLSVDLDNLFVCGISNGGFMAQRLAFEMPHKIKAIGIVAANLSVEQSQKAPPQQAVPLIFICGTHDPLVPYYGGQITVFKQKRGEILSVAASVEYWKKINGADQQVGRVFFPDTNKADMCTATKTIWQNPEEPGLKVVDITVQNGGHTWPGTKNYLPKRLIGNTNRDFNACDEIWDFFTSLNNK
jgi:polyhydroxybutyrate depolymerase